jgi:hypothetical protein
MYRRSISPAKVARDQAECRIIWIGGLPHQGNGMSIDDKRRHTRKALRTEGLVADVLGNTWSKVDMLDISGSGAAFISAEEYATGSARMLRFHLPGHSEHISAACKIVHSAAHSYLPGYRIGVEFVRMHENELAAVRRFTETGD